MGLIAEMEKAAERYWQARNDHSDAARDGRPLPRGTYEVRWEGRRVGHMDDPINEDVASTRIRAVASRRKMRGRFSLVAASGRVVLLLHTG